MSVIGESRNVNRRVWYRAVEPSFRLLFIIIYIRQSQQTEVFLLGALNDYEDARGKLGENRRSE